ncbi:von Willebrand factor type A domain-containing protein [Micromonospora palomenae]|uniref:von Willebrand factor type A domain-containing protein n=1 Tax=Micromonospora palomenae TaxID=1461247 RepID=A0A561VHC0_9ACTN|nr:VWA domain-containing protein [Micromonospora palomenae]TWG11010.1 von Willebrand factor type A domain-containing protein [Micromonospora palomenae]
MADSRGSDDKVLALAFYLLVDVSFSMQGAPLDAVNRILPEVIDAIEESPTLGDVVRFGALDFADDARTVLPLGDLRDVKNIPQFIARGGTSYTAAFRQLRKDIERDLTQMKMDGYKVYRPAVFFITDGEPIDDRNSLQAAFAELTDPSFRGRPNIIPFGVTPSMQKAVLEPWVFPKPGASGKPMRSYVYNGAGDAATAIKQIAEVLISSIVASANSVNDAGAAGGFVPPDDDDLGDWI